MTAPDLVLPGCLFCDLNGHRILCETDQFYARYDNFPAFPGHAEIVPKRHVESLLDLTPAMAAEAHMLLVEACEVIRAEHGPVDAFNFGVNDGPAAGQSIGHLHTHVIPRRHGDMDDPAGGIRRAFPCCDPNTWMDSPR